MIRAAGEALHTSGLDWTVELGAVVVALLLLLWVVRRPPRRFVAKMVGYGDVYTFQIWDSLEGWWLLDSRKRHLEFPTMAEAEQHAATLNAGGVECRSR